MVKVKLLFCLIVRGGFGVVEVGLVSKLYSPYLVNLHSL